MLYRIYNDKVDDLAKRGVGQHAYPRGITERAKRGQRITAIIQHMMVTILAARDPEIIQ